MNGFPRLIGLAMMAVLFLAAGSAQAQATVKKGFPDFTSLPVAPSPYVTATCQFQNVDDAPEGSPLPRSMKLSVNYSGKGFEHSGVTCLDGAIPGNCRKISLWAKGSRPGIAWMLKFKDGKGQETVNGKKLEFEIKAGNGKWTKNEFAIPAGWEQPITLTSILSHNWSDQKTAAAATLEIHALEIETDTAAVEDKARLVSVSCGSGIEANVFAEGMPIAFDLAINSWLGRENQGSIAFQVMDAAGATVATGGRGFAVTDSFQYGIKPEVAKFGAYVLAVTVEGKDFKPYSRRFRFALVPRPHQYTEAEKLASPYGLNMHGGKTEVVYSAFAKLGFTWIRDYAYTFSWMNRAKGEDGKYGGWPWYPKMDRQVRDSGLMLLPCLMGMMSDGVKAGRMEMEQKRKLELLQILMAFPQYAAWEADNEYDYALGKAEAARDWSAYGAYLKTFGETVKFINPKTWAVEQGNAGFHPERTRKLIERGVFDKIDVINGHFYCGTTPPELNRIDFNANQGLPVQERSLYDALRAYKQAASCDGRPRQAWITEFGWDTLAGHIVSETEQAAYLQRGYMLGFLAGIDKMFWFNADDTKEKPANFFDGCGIFDPHMEPKPVAAAMAALAHFLRQPQALGTFSLGDNSRGYVFSDQGRLVAAVFKIDARKSDIALELGEGELFDCYGNPLKSRRLQLGVAPVWMTGIREDGPICKQTAFDLQSNEFNRLVAGDAHTIELRVRNRRQTPIAAAYELLLPPGWTAASTKGDIAAAPGATVVIPIQLRADPNEHASLQRASVIISEPGIRKQLDIDFAMILPGTVKVEPLTGDPGKTRTTATITNQSSSPRTLTVKTRVPAGWTIAPAQIDLKDLQPNESRTVGFDVLWSGRWNPDDRAEISVCLPDGRKIAGGGIIPPALSIPPVKNLVFDGKLDDWPAAAKLPDWLLGGPNGAADIYAGYSDEGLYLAFDVKESKLAATDPRSFWSQDSAEIFVDTAGDKRERKEYQPTDHQFWVCPQFQASRAYLGRWKRNHEIKETEYDIPGIKSGCRKTDRGYVMEVLIPAAGIIGFKAEKGRKIGLDIILNIKRAAGNCEVYWPREKADNVPACPRIWGTAELK